MDLRRADGTLSRGAPGDNPRAAMLIVCGMAGTGKSTVVRMLGDSTGFQLVNSDVVRKRLAHRARGRGIPGRNLQ